MNSQEKNILGTSPIGKLMLKELKKVENGCSLN